jgi:hypothetical protein
MANVFSVDGDLSDRETAALGPSKGEEFEWLGVLVDADQQPNEVDRNIRRQVDGVVYEQLYLEPTEANLRYLLQTIEDFEITSRESLLEPLIEIRAVLSSGDQSEIDKLVDSIQQLRLFDARDKDLSQEAVDFHPITIDIKFKATESDDLNRKAIKWRSNENGDQKMIEAIDVIKSDKAGQLGKVKRYIIAYEYLPQTVVEAIKAELGVAEIGAETLSTVFDVMASEFAVKLDVRYDVVTSPSGKEVKIVTREAEVDGDDNDKVNWHLSKIQEALDGSGYVTFKPEDLNYGELAISKDPGTVIDQILSHSDDPSSIKAAMKQQVELVIQSFGDDRQIVVTIPDKGEKIAVLNKAGDMEALKKT